MAVNGRPVPDKAQRSALPPLLPLNAKPPHAKTLGHVSRKSVNPDLSKVRRQPKIETLLCSLNPKPYTNPYGYLIETR